LGELRLIFNQVFGLEIGDKDILLNYDPNKLNISNESINKLIDIYADKDRELTKNDFLREVLGKKIEDISELRSSTPNPVDSISGGSVVIENNVNLENNFVKNNQVEEMGQASTQEAESEVLTKEVHFNEGET
jgi:hypothetical protein